MLSKKNECSNFFKFIWACYRLLKNWFQIVEELVSDSNMVIEEDINDKYMHQKQKHKKEAEEEK